MELKEFTEWKEKFVKNNDITKMSIEKIMECAFVAGAILPEDSSTKEYISNLETVQENTLPDGEKWATDEELEEFDFGEWLENKKKAEEKNETK